MASRSATVLVIFVIAIIAFCLASVFGAMTGPISIFPNGTDNNTTILDNLSAIGEDNSNSYEYNDYNDYSSSSSDSGSSNVETTTDDSSQSDQQRQDQGDSGKGQENNPSNPTNLVTSTR